MKVFSVIIAIIIQAIPVPIALCDDVIPISVESGMEVSWQSSVGFHYLVQYAQAVDSEGWKDLGPRVSGNDARRSVLTRTPVSRDAIAFCRCFQTSSRLPRSWRMGGSRKGASPLRKAGLARPTRPSGLHRKLVAGRSVCIASLRTQGRSLRRGGLVSESGERVR